MPPRVVRILLIALPIAVMLYLVGYLILHSGDSEPGSGTGETIIGLSTP